MTSNFVPTSYLEVVAEKVGKMNRRSTKKNMPLITLVTGKVEKRPACRVDSLMHDHTAACPTREWTEVSIVGDTPRIGPWSLVASVDNVEGKPIFRTVPGQSVPVEFRDNDPMACEYCNVNRYRTETFIVTNSDTGEYKQAGRQCIRDFLGWDVDSLVRYYEMLSNITEEPDGGWSSGSDWAWSPIEIIRVAARVVAVDGRYYRSDNPIGSTKSVVLDILIPPQGGIERGWYKELIEKYADSPRATEILDATMAAIPELNASGDWAYNVQTAANAGSVGIRQVGILASATILGLRAIEDKATAPVTATPAANVHIGSIGDKVNINVTLTDITTMTGYYGTTFLYTFITVDGNIVKWFSSNNVNISKDSNYNLTGTIKKLDEFRGKRQTIVTRCKVVAS